MMLQRPAIVFAALTLLAAAYSGDPARTEPADEPGAPRPRSAPTRPRPTVLVEASYPGASAQVVADTVAAPIEQQVNGIEKMLFMRSHCTNEGRWTLSVTFAPGVDLNAARVLVQNRVALAYPTLPEIVKRLGVTVTKQAPNVLMIVTLSSPDRSRDTLFLGNYASIQFKDEFARVAGVGVVTRFGQPNFSVRVRLDPEKLTAFNLTAGEVFKAIEAQNVDVARGRIGQPPVGKGKDVEALLRPIGRGLGVEEFGEFILKTTPNGSLVYLKDVAQVQPTRSNPRGAASLNGMPVVGVCLSPQEGARPRDVSAAVRDKLRDLRAKLPKGLAAEVAIDFSANLEAPGRPTTPEYLLLDVDLPAAASGQRVRAVLERCNDLLRKGEGVDGVLTLFEAPRDLFGNGNCILVRLAPPGKREADREQLVRTVRTRLEAVKEMALRVRDVSAAVDSPRWGYPVELAVHGPEADRVKAFASKLAERLRDSKKLTDVWTGADAVLPPQLYLEVDRAALKRLGVSLQDAFKTLQIYLGGDSGDDFGKFNRTWQVVVQAGARFRLAPEDVKKLKVRNARGEMVPLGAFVKVRETAPPPTLDRLDGQPMQELTANPAAGTPLAEVRGLGERLAEEVRKELRLPRAYRATWLRELPAK